MSSSLEISDGKIEGRFEVFLLGEETFGSEARIEISSSLVSSCDKVSYKLEVSALGKSLGV